MLLDHQWVVSKDGADWKIGRPAAHVILSGDHPAEALDDQLLEWGMKRSQLVSFEPEELREEFEDVFGPVGKDASVSAG
jgi:hypothetical protein